MQNVIISATSSLVIIVVVILIGKVPTKISKFYDAPHRRLTQKLCVIFYYYNKKTSAHLKQFCVGYAVIESFFVQTRIYELFQLLMALYLIVSVPSSASHLGLAASIISGTFSSKAFLISSFVKVVNNLSLPSSFASFISLETMPSMF